MTPEEKDQLRRETFNRVFPPRVDKLIKALDVMSNCSNKSSYAWNQDLIHDVFVTIAQIFQEKAKLFGIDFVVMVDGTEVQYADPKRKTK